MNPFIELAVDLAEKAFDVAVRVINASAEHSAEERAALIASLKARLDAKAAEVAAVKFRDV